MGAGLQILHSVSRITNPAQRVNRCRITNPEQRKGNVNCMGAGLQILHSVHCVMQKCK